MRNVLLVLAGAAVMAVAVLALPFVLLAQYLHHRRMRAAAVRSACAVCGTILGRAALRAADAEWDGFVAEWRARHPHAKPRMVRRVHAVCPRCRAQHRYVAAGRRFEPVPADAEPGPSPVGLTPRREASDHCRRQWDRTPAGAQAWRASRRPRPGRPRRLRGGGRGDR